MELPAMVHLALELAQVVELVVQHVEQRDHFEELLVFRVHLSLQLQ